MIIVFLAVLGLMFGSFVNALVWRLHKQSKSKKPTEKYSITKGRSMCVDCGHTLGAKDLVPVFSWLYLKGKCRYCKKPISWQYPAVELLTAVVFVASYIFWPADFNLVEYLILALWLACTVGFMALIIYDIRWMLLPNKIVFPLYFVALAVLVLRFIQNPELSIILGTLAGILVGGGIFYILFQVSKGKWIGGGDVKLGFLLGALAGTAQYSFLLLFMASVLGVLFILPSLLTGKLKKSTRIPFGPFLITGCIIVVLFGNRIITWYLDKVLAIST